MIVKERDDHPAANALEIAGERAERQMAFYLARGIRPLGSECAGIA